MLNKTNKIILSLILVVFFSFNAFVFLARPVKAQLLVNDPSNLAFQVNKEIKYSVGTQILQSLTTGLVQIMNNFAQKIARDAAVWVSSGFKGQKPLFDGRTIKNLVRDSAITAARDVVRDTFKAASGGYLDVDLCAPKLPSVLLKLQLGLLVGTSEAEKKPDCTWNKLADNWEQLSKSMSSGELLSQVGVMFDTKQSGLGVALELNSKVVASAQDAKNQALADRIANKGYKGVSSIVTGRILTPADAVKASFYNSFINGPSNVQGASISMFGDALGKGAFQVMGSAVATFTNTLLSKATEKLVKGLFLSDLLSDDNGSLGGDSIFTDSTPGSFSTGIRKAQQVFSDLIIPTANEVTDYNPLINFVVCPNDTNVIKKTDNCVLDNSFASAIYLAKKGTPITIKQAIDQGYIDGNKPLISSQDYRNKQNTCYKEGYCYSNLVKLRRARILPVGFELAAEVSITTGKQYSLNDVINNFYDCNAKGLNDSSHPFCKLIDPNWILKLPESVCEAKAYGETLVSRDSSLRAEVCVDDKTCLLEDENGKCIGGYGYCTKEKNVWKIAADRCGEQYNTCLSYTTRDNKKASYLSNTVEYDSCSINNVGCRAYSTNKDNSGNWNLDINNTVFFNKGVEACFAENAGCTQLIPKDTLRQNLIPNSSFEKRVDANNIIDWTYTPAPLPTPRSLPTLTAFNGFEVAFQVSNTPRLELNANKAIKLDRNTSYTFSGYAKDEVGGAFIGGSSGQIAIAFYSDPANTGSIVNPSSFIRDCEFDTSNNRLYVTTQNLDTNPQADFIRYSCSFLTPVNQTIYARVSVLGGGYSFDALQLEEGLLTNYMDTEGYTDQSYNYMKVAPDYIDCSIGSTDPACSKYAPVCREEEVGCSSFTPSNGTPSISGIASVKDLCPQECVGYDAYKPDKTLFDDPSPTNVLPFEYFIPNTANSCEANNVGCSEFTNLDNESLEYFNFLRQCEKPGTGQDVFFVWESFESGPQLKSYTLKIGPTQSGESGPVPAYVTGFNNYNACTKTIFNLPITDPNYNPDCTEFVNGNGDVSYRLLSQTIIVSKDCTQYRKTKSNKNDCDATGGSWNSTNNFCVYDGYKAESSTCPATANQCRAYSGGTASNLKIILQDDFESGTTDGWSGGVNSTESLGRNGSSLKSVPIALNSQIQKSLTGEISANNSYILSFWAKSATIGGQDLILESNDFSFENTPRGDRVSLGGVWQKYEIGPIVVNSVGSMPELILRLDGGSVFFIDNIVFKEVNEKLYIIEDSWNTPATCDQTVVGQFSPQAMLGCREYTDQDNDKRYLKSFSNLCRDEAVGCKSFINTYNSESRFNETYNLLCVLDNRLGGQCQYAGQDVCQVNPGSVFCRFKVEDKDIFNVIQGIKQDDYSDLQAYENVLIEVATKAGGTAIVKDESTVNVPADKPVYLVDDGAYSCKALDMGCYEFGVGELYNGSNPSSKYFKNRPDEYSQNLCGAEAEGCESWSSAKTLDYFKVPRAECVYRDSAIGTTGGWFKKDNPTEPCYPSYIKNNIQSLWFNGDTDYNGSVGLCPDNQNGCTEFIDPQDLSGLNLKGKPYYLIDNQKLEGLEKDCNGLVSKDEGCILFNNTSDLNITWSSKDTYNKATAQKLPIAPISNLATNDTNTILHVTRDRVCAEWLACKTFLTANNPITNKEEPLCLDVGLCNKQILSNDPNNTICANFIDDVDSGKILDATYYSGRDISWSGLEYSGYSLGNKYQISDVDIVNISNNSNPDMRLIAGGGGTPSKFCRNDISLEPCVGVCVIVDGAPVKQCVDNSNCNTGAGYYCGYYGGDLTGALFTKDTAESVTCRAYPEQSSPFPSYLANFTADSSLIGAKQSAQEFQNAFFCADGEQCECNYTKLTFGSSNSLKKFITYNKVSEVDGICQGGPRDGLSCVPGISYDLSPDESCGKPELGGTCLKLKHQDNVLGWQGYCLERDYSTTKNASEKEAPCITWLPQDLVPGGVDIYNQFDSAGYQPPAGSGRYYCFEGTGRSDDNVDYKLASFPIDPYEWFLYTNSSNIREWQINILSTYEAWTDFPITRFQGRGTPSIVSFVRNGDLAIETLQAGTSVPAPIFTSPYNVAGAHYDSPVSTNMHKDEIDYINIEFANNAIGGLFENYMTPFDTGFYITQADTTPHDYIPGSICNTKNRTNCSGEYGPGLSIGQANRKVQKARSVIEGNKWYFLYYGSRRENGTDFTATNLLKLDLKDAETICKSNINFETNALVLEFNFDDNGYFQDVRVASCNNGFTFPPYNVMKVRFKLREMCRTLVDLAGSKSQGRTNELWSFNPKNSSLDDSNSGNITRSHPTPYRYNQALTPFASAASNVKPKNKAWYSYWEQAYDKSPIFGGNPWFSFGKVSIPVTTNGSTNLEEVSSIYHNVTDAATSFYNIFKKANKFYRWNFKAGKYIEYDCSDPSVNSPVCFNYDIGGIDVNKEPVIYSFDTSAKLLNGQYDLAEKGTFVINDSFNTPIDIKGNQFEARFKFYFWTDTDFMPITGLKIDWDDGSKIVETRNSKYKNHKPICAQNNVQNTSVCSFDYNIPCELSDGSTLSCPDGSTCTKDAITFGNSPDACDEKYFEIVHVYTCNKISCSFQPKVTITDNWGQTATANYNGTITLTP